MNGVLDDTSVWVDHFRQRNDALGDLLAQDRVLIHPMVRGELACGTPPVRERTLADLSMLQPSVQDSLQETIDFVERQKLPVRAAGLTGLTQVNCATP